MEKRVKRGTVLQVPYEEKDEAKSLGAMWDPDMKKWFVPENMSVRPFERWLPDESSTK